MNDQVTAWYEDVTIPTYEVGAPEKNPVFLEKRVYQGSSGVVYPYPVIEKIYDQKKDKIWKAVFLENEYLKIMILPELGGRIQMAYDKTKKRHFVYYNQVIKPALVGLAGPWISGGIEFNWPQHHRPGTFDPVDYTIEEYNDGSKTVWCSEIERMFRTKGMAGFTLYPGKAYLEIKVRLYNRTPHPQTFLWWANPAVHVNDDYQSVFPPDVNAVFDHGKRDVSTYPIATGTYYKVDYSAGVDISKYKNIPVPTSYMAIKSDYDFIGCYENDTKGGMLHVANHHISPGKKQWTWGKGDFGFAWDRNLTDEDGPYIELMCGVYTDNQPDFSWLMPYEEKSFRQYFMPYRDLGVIKNASKEAMVNLELKAGLLRARVYTSARYKNLMIEIWQNKNQIFVTKTNLDPTTSFDKTIKVDKKVKLSDFLIEVKNNEGKTLVSWQAEKDEKKTIPQPAKAALLPPEITNNEQLYLTGLHLEQYRHATFSASDYYQEALRRDPGDIRCNNAMGLLHLKKAQFREAEIHFREAIETLTERNPNPYEGEPYFNLGLALRFQFKDKEAYEAFYKAIWNDAWQASGYFQLAQLAVKQNMLVEAIELIDKSLIRQWHNHKARHLKIAILRLNKEKESALSLIEESLAIDKFNFGLYYEKYLLTNSEEELVTMHDLLQGNVHNYIEVALDYAWAGLFNEAIEFLYSGIKIQDKEIYPMAWYYLGWFCSRISDLKRAKEFYKAGEKEEPGICFPNQLESVLALNDCIHLFEKAGKAHYYLGNFYYHHRLYDIAVNNWEQSLKYKVDFPTVRRNLALAYYNKFNKKKEALEIIEQAFRLDMGDARVFMELDALRKRMNMDYKTRLASFEKHMDLVNFRDDLYLEHLSLKNFLGKHQETYEAILNHKFHPWEGGEGKVTGQYVFSLVEMAKEDIQQSRYKLAIDKLEKAKVYPHNLGEGKLYGAQENDINFWIGYSYENLKQHELAEKYYILASAGISEPAPAIFYNDQPPDKIFYQGLSLLKLNKTEEAQKRFNKLIAYGQKHMDDKVKMDYFAVSLPDLLIWDDDLDERNKIHCLYLIALGNLGLGNLDKAWKIFIEILVKDLYHTGAFIHLRLMESQLLNFNPDYL